MKEFEKKLIAFLQEDARYTSSQLAVMLGSDEKTVTKAVEKLEADGVIVKYTTVINAEKTGEEIVDALVEVKVAPQARSGFEKIAQEIAMLPQVKSVYLMSGAYDFAVNLEGATMRGVALFISERLSTIESVLSVTTHFILKKYKEGGVDLSSFYDKDERLPIHE